MNAPPPFPLGALLVLRRNVLVWRSRALSSLVASFGEPLLYLLSLGYGLGTVVPAVEGMSYPEFFAPGLVTSTVMYTATFEGTFGSYTRLSTQKTFDAILATPIGVAELVAGEILWGALKGTLSSSCVLIAATALGLVPSPLALLVPFATFVAGLFFASSALLVTALARSYESFNYYLTAVVAPMFLLSGVFFPLSGVPPWLRWLPWCSPLSHVVAVVRPLVRGRLEATAPLHLAVLLLFAACAYLTATRVLERRLRH